MNNYRFWLETYDGRNLVWAGLTKAQALGMYRCTDKRTPENVKHYGWEEAK